MTTSPFVFFLGSFLHCSLTAQSTYICRVQSCVWRLPKCCPPPPLSTQRVCPSPEPKAGGYTLAGRWGGGGSIFWKTPDIGLASYSIISPRLTVVRGVLQIQPGAITTCQRSKILRSFPLVHFRMLLSFWTGQDTQPRAYPAGLNVLGNRLSVQTVKILD